jgi:hypothetical protein
VRSKLIIRQAYQGSIPSGRLNVSGTIFPARMALAINQSEFVQCGIECRSGAVDRNALLRNARLQSSGILGGRTWVMGHPCADTRDSQKHHEREGGDGKGTIRSFPGPGLGVRFISRFAHWNQSE